MRRERFEEEAAEAVHATCGISRVTDQLVGREGRQAGGQAISSRSIVVADGGDEDDDDNQGSGERTMDAKGRSFVRSLGTQLTDRQRVKDRRDRKRERNGRKFSNAF